MSTKEEKRLKEAHDLLIEVKDENKVFRLYKGQEVIGEPIFRELIKKRMYGKNYKGEDHFGFYLNDKFKTVGLMSQLYGLNALLSLINRYNLKTKDDGEKGNNLISSEDRQIIKDGLNEVIKHIEKNGYDLSPHIDHEINKQLFLVKDDNTGNRYSYMGARTWGLALFIAARVAHRKKIIDFSNEMDQIKEHIKNNIIFFIKNVIYSTDNQSKVDSVGDPIGWGYADGCIEEPSLFFTYSVVEAFADFDDACITDRDDELLNYLNEGRTGERLENEYKNLCYKMGDRAWKIFGTKLKDFFFNDRFDEDARKISEEEITNSSRSSALFNNLYIIFILFYTYTNHRQKNKIENEAVESAMSQGLQLIQNLFDELTAAGKENIIERHILAFDQEHCVKGFGKELNNADIQASSLLPMLVKANNLIARYIYKFPQKQMGTLLDSMFKTKLDEEWLWENNKFDLLSTVRYLESIADFFEYYNDFEKPYAVQELEIERQKEEARNEVKAEVTKETKHNIRLEIEKEYEEIFVKEKSEIEKSFPIESMINDRIEEKINKVSIKIFCNILNTLSNYNVLSDKEKTANPLKDEEKLLFESIQKYFYSVFEKQLISTAVSYDVDENKLKEAALDDIKDTTIEFFEFIAENNFDKGIKREEDKRKSLKRIFKLILSSKEEKKNE